MADTTYKIKSFDKLSPTDRLHLSFQEHRRLVADYRSADSFVAAFNLLARIEACVVQYGAACADIARNEPDPTKRKT